MTSFRPFDIVKVPYPYGSRPAKRRRPALVIAAGDLEQRHGLLWLAMITAAENKGWPGDVTISDTAAAGLPVASVIRTAKITTIDSGDAEPLGTLAPADRDHVVMTISGLLSGLFGAA
jgi:mRNA interferase MazF